MMNRGSTNYKGFREIWGLFYLAGLNLRKVNSTGKFLREKRVTSRTLNIPSNTKTSIEPRQVLNKPGKPLQGFMEAFGYHKKLIVVLIILLFPFGALSQATLSKLSKAFASTSSLREKADISYSISKIYNDALKVDSAIFFANKIKEYSLAAHYQMGLGKHYLSMGSALFLRRREVECEEHLRKAITIFNSEKNYLFLGMAWRQLAANYDNDKDFLLSRKMKRL